MYCDQCGMTVKPTSKFCHSCGHQLVAPVTEPVSTQALAEPDRHVKTSAEVITSSKESVSPHLNGEVRLDRSPPENHQESSVEPSGAPGLFFGAHHPWPRFFARVIDMALVAPLLYFSLFYPIGEYPFIEFLLGTYRAAPLAAAPLFIAVIVFVLWVPIEAVFLSAFGATFGKWVFGIRVQNSDGKLLSYGKAFIRSCKVLLFGLVFNLPIINMVACLLSYMKLVKTGSTVWDHGADTKGKVLVVHRPWSLVRGGICVLAIFVVLVSGVLTPVIVAKVYNNYWVGRGNLPPLASSAGVAMPSAEQPQASKVAQLSDAEDIVDSEEKRKLEVAANQGDAVAQYAMGKISSSGGNNVEAARWLRLAAAQGNAKAQNHLGNLYFSGLGVPKDTKESLRLYRLAAAQGVAAADRSLGFAYEIGEGVPQDKKASLHYYGLAADEGDIDGIFGLAGHYWRGPFLPEIDKNKTVIAYALYNLGCSQSCSPGQASSRDLLYSLMDDRQLKAGQELTRQMVKLKPTTVIARYLKNGAMPR